LIGNEINFLYRIQTENYPSLAELPSYSDLYEINLSTREISSPEFLGIKKDHNAEVVYFIMDRFYDFTDLSTTVGIIQYLDPDGNIHIYPIPYYDIYSVEGKMILPWNISRIVTNKAGEIEYFLRFYKITGTSLENFEISYNLNTKTAKTRILTGLDAAEIDHIENEEEQHRLQAETYEAVMEQIKENQVTWLEI
jgi:hypothetical protein